MGYAADETVSGAAEASQERNSKTEPLPLDLSTFCNATTRILHNENGKVYGRCVFDGMPFEVSGTIRLYGESQAANQGDKRPVSVKGVRIGCKFEELHVVHYAMWPDADGQTIGYLCLNYDDGTESILPIRYGVHVRDWYNLPSYEKEAVKDPNTTVCWRRPPDAYKAPIRLFKSKLLNPSPEKVVKTMDIVSARSLAGYNVIAATVADHDSVRAEKLVGDRKFDGKLLIRVVDDSTGQPIEGAFVYPGMNVLDEGVVGSPFYTSSAGEGTIPFPTKDTKYVQASVKKEGYRPDSHTWQPAESGTFTFRLVPGGRSGNAIPNY